MTVLIPRKANAFKHGELANRQVSVEYRAYRSAKSRCDNPNDAGYMNYGGRGVEFRFTSFNQFLAAVGRKPSPQHSIGRIDNDGHYELGNVKWSTPIDQANNKRNNRYITINGETLTVGQWVKRANTNHTRVFQRIAYGFCDECAVMLPKFQQCSHRGEN